MATPTRTAHGTRLRAPPPPLAAPFLVYITYAIQTFAHCLYRTANRTRQPHVSIPLSRTYTAATVYAPATRAGRRTATHRSSFLGAFQHGRVWFACNGYRWFPGETRQTYPLPPPYRDGARLPQKQLALLAISRISSLTTIPYNVARTSCGTANGCRGILRQHACLRCMALPL